MKRIMTYIKELLGNWSDNVEHQIDVKRGGSRGFWIDIKKKMRKNE